MKNIVVILFCVLLGLTGCQPSGSKSNEGNSKEVTDSAANDTSKVWHWVNYDDGFGNMKSDKFLQANIKGHYTDPNVQDMQMDVFISIDPNIGLGIFHFSNGTNFLKGQGEMLLSIKDSDGAIHTAKMLNDQDGLTYTIGLDKDIVFELLKTEKPLDFRIEQQTMSGPIRMIFKFKNDNHFNKMLKEVPFRDKSSYGVKE